MLLHVAAAASSAQAVFALAALLTLIFVIAAIVSELQGAPLRRMTDGSRRRSRRHQH